MLFLIDVHNIRLHTLWDRQGSVMKGQPIIRFYEVNLNKRVNEHRLYGDDFMLQLKAGSARHSLDRGTSGRLITSTYFGLRRLNAA